MGPTLGRADTLAGVPSPVPSTPLHLPPPPPAAVLFDFDGTLCDSEAGIVEHLRRALVTVGLPIPSEEALRSCVGPPWELGGLDHIGVPRGRLDEVIATYRATYNVAAPALTHPFDGVVEALAALRGAGLPLAVATSKPQGLVERIVGEGPLAPWFAAVMGADPRAGRHDKADVVGAALAAVGPVDPAEVVMVGDRRYDVEGAAVHGVATVGARWGAAPPGELEEAGAAAVADTPADLVALLTGAVGSGRATAAG